MALKRYLAFISYRHTDRDNAVAEVLRHGLEGFHAGRRSSLPRVRRVFRDTDELPTSSDLGADIENALKDSEWLIALCSEDYTQSRWCISEIRRFIALGRRDRILPVLVSGTPETSMPEEIRDLAPAADLRGREGGLKSAAKDCVPALLARMTGEDADALLSCHRRFRLGQLACGAAALALGVFGFALYANRTANVISDNNRKIEVATEEAWAAQEEAVAERNNALLNQAAYTAQSCDNRLSDGDVDGAIREALDALPEDLHGELPVSDDLLCVLRTALCIHGTSFERVHVTPLDFSATGCDRLSSRSELLTLTGDGIAALNFSTGELSTPAADLSDAIREAVEAGLIEGYNHVIGVNSGSSGYAVFYDADKPLGCVETWDTEMRRYTLNGEPFLAEGVVRSDQSDSKGKMLAWRGGDAPVAALFSAEKDEAVATLQGAGAIVSASFISARQVAAVDDAGTLRVYDVSDGSELWTAEGGYRFVQYYYYGSGRLFAIADDGGLRCLEAATGKELWESRLDSPALSLDCCRDDGSILIVCEEGARLCSLSDGSEKERLRDTGGARLAAWDAESDGRRFVLIYDDRAELYGEARMSDPDLSESAVLTDPKMPCGSPLAYSADGKYVYTHFRGDFAKWDAATGELLWVNESDWGEYWGDLTTGRMNVAGDAYWRQTYSGNGLEKINADTGETLYSVKEMAGSYFPMPQESPDGKLGLIVSNKYSHGLVVFETDTGNALWRKDLYEDYRPLGYSARFTEDSGEVWVKLYLANPDGFTRSEVICRFDARSGALLEEAEVGDGDALMQRFLDLPTGEPARQTVTAFGGEDAKKSGDRIVRASDGAPLLDCEQALLGSGLSASYIDAVSAPDGESLCMGGYAQTPPLLVRPSDMDALVAKAKRRTGGDAQ